MTTNLVTPEPGGEGNPGLTAQRLKNLPLKERARALLEDKEYLTSLQLRLNAGEAGALEVWLYRFGYGDPKIDKSREEDELERFEEMRSLLRQVLADPKKAKALEIAVSRRKTLRRPKLAALPLPLEPRNDDAG